MAMSLAGAAIIGLGLGLRHALETDHVTAVCTFVSRDGSVARAAKSGALWGMGHGLVVVLAGGALILTGVLVPPSVAIALDVLVALMLVGLGVLNLFRRASPNAQRGERSPRRSFAVGVVHGASGTAALTLLVATTIANRTHALAFIALFGVASALGMTAMAALVAWPLRSVVKRKPGAAPIVRGLAGAASIAAGVAVGFGTLGLA